MALRTWSCDSSLTDGRDLRANRGVMGTLVYSLAPGLDLFSELNEFRAGEDFETSAPTVGTALTF